MTEDDFIDQTDYIAFDLKSPETALKMANGFRILVYFRKAMN